MTGRVTGPGDGDGRFGSMGQEDGEAVVPATWPVRFDVQLPPIDPHTSTTPAGEYILPGPPGCKIVIHAGLRIDEER